MTGKASITIDTREPKGLRNAVALSADAEGIESQELALKATDYLITSVSGFRSLSERKAINDLHNSIADGRLFRELAGALEAQDVDEVNLIIEGDLWMGKTGMYGITYARAGVHANSIRGALLWAQRRGVRLIFTKDIDDTVQALLWLAKSRPKLGEVAP